MAVMGVRNAKGTSLKGIPTPVDPDQVTEGGENDTSFLPVQPVAAPASPQQADPEDTSFLPVQPPKTQDLYKSVSQVDPDHAAKVLSISQKSGESPAFIENNLDQIQKDQNAPAPSFFSELESKYPGTTKFLAQPQNMAVAHDDMQNLSKHEDLVQRISLAHSWADDIRAGWQQSVFGMESRGKEADVVESPDASLPHDLLAQATSLLLDTPFMMAGGVAGGLVGASAGAIAGGAVGTLAGPGGTLIGGGVGALAGGAAGAAYGSWATPAMIKQYLHQQYTEGGSKNADDMWNRTIEILKKGNAQGLLGIATAGTGTIGKEIAGPVGKVVGKALGSTAGKAIEKTLPLAGEVGTMTVGGAAAEGKDLSDLRAKDFLEGGLLVGAMHGAGAGTEKVMDIIQARKAVDAKAFYTALGETSEASKLRDRMPEAHQELISQLTKDGPVENIYIPVDAAEQYFQSKKLDTGKVMDELGVGKSYADAKETGGDVEIPLSTWTDKVVGTEHYQGLADDVKFSPDDLTVRQVNEKQAEIAAQMQAVEKQAQDEARIAQPDQDQQPPATGSKIFEAISKQLKDAGLTSTEARLSPQLHEAFFNTLGQHLGVAPEELFDRYGLKIQKTDEIKAPAVKGSSPEFNEVLAQSTGEKKLEQSAKATNEQNVVGFENEPPARPQVLYKGQPIPNKLEFYKGSEKERAQNLALGWLREYGNKKDAVEKVRGLFEHREAEGKSTTQLRPVLDALLGIKDEDVKTSETSLNQSSKDEGARGRIVFATQGSERQFTIELAKAADKSTFLHESGHYFLEVMGDVASQDKASPELKADYKSILDFLGVKSKEEITTEGHEKFARAFESYLMEGKAPSEGLRKAFARFRDWLVGVYKHMKNLNVELTPEFRAVMDRMLASKEEIEHASKLVDYKPEDFPGVSPEVGAKIRDLQERAREMAETTLLKEQMKEISEQNLEFIKKERSNQEVLAKELVDKSPLFSAIADIKEGAKLDESKHAQEFLDDQLHIKDAAKFEEVAETHGFASGEELANKIIDAKKNDLYNKQVKTITDVGMERFAPMKDSGAIREEALKAIHNERMTEVLALERETLAGLVKNAELKNEVSKRNRISAAVEAKAAKDQAKLILSKKSLKDAASARVYITAERNAAVKVAKAIGRKDFEAAAEFKRQQMLNHALVSEALKNKEEIEKSVDFLDKYAKRGADLMNMPYGFIRQVDGLLSRFQFSEPRGDDAASLIKTAKDMADQKREPDEIANATGYKLADNGQWVPETLPDFVQRVNDNYYGLSVPDTVMGDGKSYKELTMSELRDLQGSVKAIADVGKKYERFLGEFETADIREAARKFRASVEENVGTRYADIKKMGSSDNGGLRKIVKAIGDLSDAMIPDMVNMATLAKYLDGGKNDGFFHQYIYRPLKAAEDRKFSRYQKMTSDIQEMFSKFYTPKELASYKDKASEKYFPAIDSKLTKEQVLSLALNWGNEGNRARIRSGYNVTDEQVKAITDTLSKKDWDFVQATWDHLGSYWPEISELERRVNGVEAKKIELSPVETEHGTYRGGYYPISYDFEKSSEGYKTAEQKNELYKQFSAAAAHTDSGHAKERASNVSRPVRLSLDVLFNHLENVVHDLEFREPIIDVNRFLRQSDVRTALENSVGIKATKSIGDWLKAQGSDQGENLTFADKAFQWTRFATTLSTLGFTPKAFLLHLPSNVFNSAWEIGFTRTAKMLTQSMLDHVMGEGNLKDFVFSKSDRMAQRLTIRDRDIMDMAKKWQGTAALLPHYAFMSIHLADEAIALPLWSEIYKSNLEELGDVKARQIADETVTRTLGSGSMVDRIGAQRGGGLKKIFTMFYSWMSVMFNRAWLDGKIAGLEYNQGNVGKAAAIMAKATFFAWLLPAAHEALLAEAMRNSPNNNPDDQKKRIIGHFIEQPFSMMLIARDIAPPLIHTMTGDKSGADYKMSPVEQALQNLIAPAGKAVNIALTDSKHYDEKFAEDSARGVSQLMGIPQQLNTWAFNLLDYSQNNGEATWRDFLSRRKKK